MANARRAEVLVFLEEASVILNETGLRRGASAVGMIVFFSLIRSSHFPFALFDRIIP
ncbi:MAG: hypothetical protein K0Q55_1047 [Verrucomicrobia bacterium]|jgi:hypothetical protein|nr:hypothetical protein [Verrucomicrobiota bacterium]